MAIEVHTTRVTEEQWNSEEMTAILQREGFQVAGGNLLGEIECGVVRGRMVEVTQRIGGGKRC